MSQQTEQVEDSSDSVESVLDSFEDWYHVPVLAAALSFMLWVRLQSYDKFIQNGEVLFDGNDAWYHLRQVQYTVNHWPSTMPYDPWTYFPFGTSVGQFGTLYDQLVATAALIVGLGDPSHQTVATTLLVAPAVFGTLVAIPTYFVGKRLGGRPGGLFGVIVLALFPGTFLRRGLVGFADHNIAEPLFQTFALLAMMVALTVAEREKPVYELLADRDFEALRKPLGYSVLAGIATAFYLWTWPPGVLLVGIFGVFFGLKLTADYARGVSPDHLAFVGAVSMGVTGLLLLVPLGTFDFSPTKFSPLQPLLAFAVSVGCIFMAWLAREFEARDLSTALYPATVGGIVVATVGVVYVALPSLYSLVSKNLIRIIGFSTGAKARTIGEAQPFLSRTQPQFGIEWYDLIIREYGLMLFTAVVAAVWMLWRAYRSDDQRAEQLLVLVWAAFITAAAFTQVRFNYYLAVSVAVLNAYLIGRVFSWASLPSFENVGDINGTQVLAMLFVVLLVVPVLVAPASLGTARYPDTQTAMESGTGASPGDITKWKGSLDWLENSTPAVGDYGNANNADELDYYGTFEQNKSDYSYPEGSYGVMSWWDYGHWITVEGERIPNANPFQEGATTAAKYLLAPNESRANEVIKTLGAPNEETRYVMVDWKMASVYSNAGGKFFAPPAFKPNVTRSDYYQPVYRQSQRGGFQTAFNLRSQKYYESQMVRLYRYHGSRVEPQPIVVDWRARQYQTPNGQVATFKTTESGPNATLVRRFRTMKQAEAFVANDSTSQIGGIAKFPSEPVKALNHYRVVHQSDQSGTSNARWAQRLRAEMQLLLQGNAIRNPNAMFQTSPSWVKTFERVPGATVTGTGPANTTVTASVRLSPVGKNSSFAYRQQAKTGPDGQFTMTLPYSTTGYSNWGPEQGYTNVSVRATGPYQFYTPRNFEGGNLTYHNATAQITEAQVIGESNQTTTVELTKESVSIQQNRNNSTAGGNETAPNGTSGDETPPANETAGNQTAANGTSGNSTAGNGTSNDSSNASQLTPDEALPEREETTPVRAGLVGAWAGALVVAGRD
ncbi:oligosaccharyl transferase, archaeosortase A system-associated [Halorussus gelatinilyticus]|uniref:dolichyl-phosphooligosaccharide-protein glycotransferase n=1 Tax=Halorussus gelatinilyticus TaxID=2937524 RepID=A0A8U0IH64_9EURY|nr:oligosaccharyl transferase, archaeosortase A system-associated [Halorussus gelatinilyticus]UPW00313.1 oligosaccharyl transferase, archaeosortase A system-associated [Halorussus gelatinilyticus]